MEPEEFKVGVRFIYPGVGDLKESVHLSVGKTDEVIEINPTGKNAYGKCYGLIGDGGDLIVSKENNYTGFSNRSAYAKACVLINGQSNPETVAMENTDSEDPNPHNLEIEKSYWFRYIPADGPWYKAKVTRFTDQGFPWIEGGSKNGICSGEQYEVAGCTPQKELEMQARLWISAHGHEAAHKSIPELMAAFAMECPPEPRQKENWQDKINELTEEAYQNLLREPNERKVIVMSVLVKLNDWLKGVTP